MHHFVSLIVNNAGEYCAAITCQVENTFEGKIKQSALTFNDEKQLLKEEPYTKSAKAMLYWNMNVTVDKVDNIIEDDDDKELVERLALVKEEKAKRLAEESKKHLDNKWPDRWGNDWDIDYEKFRNYKQQEFSFGNPISSGKKNKTRVVDKYNAINIAAKLVTLNPCCTATSMIELKLQIKKNMTELNKVDSSIEYYGTVDAYFEAYIDYILDRFQMYEFDTYSEEMTEKQYGEFLDDVESRFMGVIKVIDDLIKEFPNLETMLTELITFLQMDMQCAMEM